MRYLKTFFLILMGLTSLAQTGKTPYQKIFSSKTGEIIARSYADSVRLYSVTLNDTVRMHTVLAWSVSLDSSFQRTLSSRKEQWVIINCTRTDNLGENGGYKEVEKVCLVFTPDLKTVLTHFQIELHYTEDFIRLPDDTTSEESHSDCLYQLKLNFSGEDVQLTKKTNRCSTELSRISTHKNDFYQIFGQDQIHSELILQNEGVFKWNGRSYSFNVR
ncbi:MAG: hypothetical protein GC181_08590 [Bacteroidetes bacterium]|nr:hypothetical protein [Bacteroidota bacterium]